MTSKWLLAASFGIASIVYAEAPLADAVMRQDVAAVQELLNKNTDPNAAQPDGSTALLWAAHWSDEETTAALIRAGANVNAANRYGTTALIEAATNGSTGLIQLLLRAGVNPNAALAANQSALMLAARSGSVGGVKALIAAGAVVDARETSRGQTALMWAVAENHAEGAKALIDAGADVNAHANVVRDPAYQPKSGPTQLQALEGMTPLLFAARQGALESIRVLLDAKAKIDETANDGSTALLVSVLNVHYDITKLLLEKGANPNLVDGLGRAPLYAAIDLRNFEISSRPAPARSAIDPMDVIKLLLDQGANPNIRLTKNMPLRGLNNFDGRWADLTGATAFLRAAQSADLPVMRLLLARGADGRIQTTDHTTALMLAAGVGFDEGTSHGAEADVPEAIRICLELGNDVNAVNDLGYTAMHGAAFRGANTVVKLLAEKGARPNVKSKEGTTPEDLALGHKFINGGFNRHEDTAALVHGLSNPSPAH